MSLPCQRGEARTKGGKEWETKRPQRERERENWRGCGDVASLRESGTKAEECEVKGKREKNNADRRWENRQGQRQRQRLQSKVGQGEGETTHTFAYVETRKTVEGGQK